ncbi:MAG: hypothetical protein MUO95_03805 [Methanoregula sp.]|jgi:hypothetical protein|nr:hypothetical protein [Methanoregula sp.]
MEKRQEMEKFSSGHKKYSKEQKLIILSLSGIEVECMAMAKLIIELKKGKDGLIEYIVTYHDPKTDNQFTLTTTNDLNEAVARLKATLESEVETMNKK